jgi:hypothetical protein
MAKNKQSIPNVYESKTVHPQPAKRKAEPAEEYSKADVIAALIRGGMTMAEAENRVNGGGMYAVETGDIKKPEITPLDDAGRNITVSLLPRAGINSYADELKERLSDLDGEKYRVFYVLPLKLTKKLYKALLESALDEASDKPDWTETDELHKLIKINDAMRLA